MDSTALPFINKIFSGSVPSDAPALCDDNHSAWLSYRELRNQIAATGIIFRTDRKNLVMCLLPRSIDAVITYLAVAASGHAIMMVDPSHPDRQGLVDRYKPDWIVMANEYSFDDYRLTDQSIGLIKVMKAINSSPAPIHNDLFLILLTSGSTGDSKGVRLSYMNITHNTLAIIDSLNLDASMRGCVHLPLAYSFGLSLLHMHLSVGGSCFLTEHGIMERPFWEKNTLHAITHFAGIPYHYHMLLRLDPEQLSIQRIKTFLQAGGKLSRDILEKMTSWIEKNHGRFFIMYGQTEASPRMACLDVIRHRDKLSTVGQPLKGGDFTIVDDEIIYRGKNVAMGYASGRKDLALEDVNGGCLRTGDTGFIDNDGYLTITGRRQRFAKLFGQRIALDHLEQITAPVAEAYFTEGTDRILIFTGTPNKTSEILELLHNRTGLPATWFDVRFQANLPRTANGKIDYRKLCENS